MVAGWLPTLGEVLELPVLQEGSPVVLSGVTHLDAPVRWVHVSELPDIAGLLKGGELLLTTGIALPSEPPALRRYVRDLRTARVAGCIVELGRKYARLPEALVVAAEQQGLPLIVLQREVPFVAVTEAVHTLIVDARVRELEYRDRVQSRLNAIALEGASVQTVLEVTAELVGQPVVLESLSHQILSFALHGADERAVLGDWPRRSREEPLAGTTPYRGPGHWLTAGVGARGDVWGRLVVVCPEGIHVDPYAVEHAAATLAIIRLSERDSTAVWAQAHQDLLRQVQERAFGSESTVESRASALGVPLVDRTLVGIAVVGFEPDAVLAGSDRLAQDLLERLGQVNQRLGIAALVQRIDAGGVLMLASFPRHVEWRRLLTQLATELRLGFSDLASSSPLLIGVGSPVSAITDARATLSEAVHVARGAGGTRTDKPFFELEDIRLRGLLYLLRDDYRLHSFVERELSPLVNHDLAHGTDLMGTLATYLASGGNKTVAAHMAKISRPTLYGQLDRIAMLLRADLNDPETCLSLHLGLLASEMTRREASDAPPAAEPPC